MTYGEILLTGLSWFVSPLAVLILGMLVLAFLISAACVFHEDFELAWAVAFALAAVVLGFFYVALAVYVFSNGIPPLSWEVSS